MPKNQKKTGRQNYDWATIQLDYVTTPDMTLRKIAAKYGINYQTVAKKSKAEGWFATRKDHQSKVIARAISKTETKQANELAQEMDFLSRMKGHVDRMLQDDMQFQRHLTETKTFDEDGGMNVYIEEKTFQKFDSRAMKDSMQILQMMESMTRSLYNIQKAEAIQRRQIELERLEIEKERLALEKERNALRNGNMDADNVYGVVLIPEVIADEESEETYDNSTPES